MFRRCESWLRVRATWGLQGLEPSGKNSYALSRWCFVHSIIIWPCNVRWLMWNEGASLARSRRSTWPSGQVLLSTSKKQVRLKTSYEKSMDTMDTFIVSGSNFPLQHGGRRVSIIRWSRHWNTWECLTKAPIRAVTIATGYTVSLPFPCPRQLLILLGLATFGFQIELCKANKRRISGSKCW